MNKWIALLLVLVVLFVMALIWVIAESGQFPQADLGESTVAGRCMLEMEAGAPGAACQYFEKFRQVKKAREALSTAEKNLVAAQAAYEKNYLRQATPVGR